LALGIFFRSRFRVEATPVRLLKGWQLFLLFLLGLAFFLSTLFSSNFNATVRMVPNMLIYLIILWGVMAEINTIEKLKFVAQVIIVLGFVLSIWRVELRPLRLLVGLPSLGINGAAFTFHPAVALALACLLFAPKGAFTLPWRWFMGITVASLILHGFQYETRAAWLAWAIMVLALISVVHWERWLRFLPLFVIVAALVILVYGSRIEFNYQQTTTTMQAALGSSGYATISSDDRLRLLARDAGVRMFQERPIFGWGANRFDFLKPSFVNEISKEAEFPGSFNSWLALLAEMGLVGAAAALTVSLTPLVITWFLLRQRKDEINTLAFGFALGVMGLAIHLLFIDLMFSYYWIHVGLALAGLRLALENRSAQAQAAV
jgi:O-antigen ligase